MTARSTLADSIHLSILIPTYKRPELLSKALESVAAQTRQADEVIVVDNDEAKTALGTIEKLNSKIVNLNYKPDSSRQGAAFAMNVAGNEASGNWLVYLDDDDYWHPEYLVTLEQAIEHSAANCIITWLAYDFDGSIIGGKKMPRQITIEKIIRDGNPGFVGTNFAVQKSLFQNLGGVDESTPTGDIDLLIRIIESGATYHVIESELTYQRQHSGARLTDLAAGHLAMGRAMLLKRHGHKVSWSARRKMRGRMHAAAFWSTHNPISKWRHSMLAVLNGDRSTTREFLKRPW